MSRDFGDKIRKITKDNKIIYGPGYSHIKTLLRRYNKECNYITDYNIHFGRYLAFSNLEYATRGIDSRLSSKFEKLAKSEAEIAELISSNKREWSDRKMNKISRKSNKIIKNKLYANLTSAGSILGQIFRNSLEGNEYIDEMSSSGNQRLPLKFIRKVDDLALVNSEQLAKIFQTNPLIIENIKRGIRGKELKKNKKLSEQQIKYTEKEYENGKDASTNKVLVEQEENREKAKFYNEYVEASKDGTIKRYIFQVGSADSYVINPNAYHTMKKLSEEELKMVYAAQIRSVGKDQFSDNERRARAVKNIVSMIILNKYKEGSGREIKAKLTNEEKAEEQALLDAITVVVLLQDRDNPKYTQYAQMIENYKEPVKKTTFGFFGRR